VYLLVSTKVETALQHSVAFGDDFPVQSVLPVRHKQNCHMIALDWPLTLLSMTLSDL